ncbi:MAG: alpha/beta hydrolase, partial [Flavobacterium sp.]
MRQIIFLFLLASAAAFSQTETEITINPIIKGSLFSPAKTDKKTKLVILIAGSGPTDRYGNQASVNNNSLKYLAQEIVKSGAAVFSYDKRGISPDPSQKIDEKRLSFEDFITDAKSVIAYFKDKKSYSKII